MEVSHWTLFKKRIDKHVPLYLGMIMCSWYQHQEMPVKWGHCISNSFNVYNGVRQGGFLFLPLFNIYSLEGSSDIF